MPSWRVGKTIKHVNWLVSGTSFHCSQVTEEMVRLENRNESLLVGYPAVHSQAEPVRNLSI